MMALSRLFSAELRSLMSPARIWQYVRVQRAQEWAKVPVGRRREVGSLELQWPQRNRAYSRPISSSMFFFLVLFKNFLMFALFLL